MQPGNFGLVALAAVVVAVSAGDPDSPPGEDGTIADIGALEYFSTGDIPERSAAQELSIYPNPASGSVSLVTTSQVSNNAEINLISIDGTIVYSGRFEFLSNRITLDLNGFSPGLYIVRIISGGKSYNKKLIVQ